MLQVIPALETGEAERWCVDMALFLKAAGGTPVVASEGGRLVHELERAGIKHYVLPLASKNPLTMRANIKDLMSIITAHDIDIVHARFRASAWSSFFAAKRSGAHFMTTFHDVYGHGSASGKFYNSVMARGERIIAISQFIADHIAQGYGVDPQRIRTVPRGIDLFRFNPDHVTPERMASLAEAWRLPDGLKVILCPEPLVRSKGHVVLLQSLARLPRRDFICVLAGSDQGRVEYSAELEQLALDLNLEGHVTMVGDCTDMPTAYMLADVIVLPSIIPEGFGRTAIEAQAMGRPVVVSDLGGLRETVISGETGWLVSASNVEALTEALDQALSLTHEQRMRLATSAITHVHTNYSKDNMGWATLDVYAELFGGPVPWALPAA